MPPCVIAIDIDGTLLRSDGTVSPRTRAALQAAHAAGIEIAIATGRRHAYAMRILHQLNLPGANAVISSNGAVIRTVDARLIHRNHLSRATASWLCTHAGPFRDSLVFTFDNVGPDGEDRPGALICETNHTLHTSVDGWMRANAPSFTHVDRLEDAFNAEPAPGSDDPAPIQAMLCGTVARMAEAEQLLGSHPAVAAIGEPLSASSEIQLHRTSYPDRDLSIVDILPAGCSKGAALNYLAVLRGCTLADTLAIGDNWNDLPMLQAAGQTILMGNAPGDLQALAQARGWQIGPTNDEDGVAQAIEVVLHEASALSVP